MTQPLDLKGMAARFISKLPTWPPSLILAQTLNQALSPLIEDESLAALINKRIVVFVEDLGLSFHFTLRQKRFVPISLNLKPDLVMRSTFTDFYLLATRQEDPDTLFFNRRLVIEGDTELGLIAKNAMDSLDLPKPVLMLCNFVKKIDALKHHTQSTKLSR